MGSLESWLLLRSLKTLHLRVPRQSETAKLLVDWLRSLISIPKGVEIDGISGGMITKVWHSSLQKKDARGFDPAEQMEGGWNATFAILASNYAFFHIIVSTKPRAARNTGIRVTFASPIKLLHGRFLPSNREVLSIILPLSLQQVSGVLKV
jgi:hypothetical protein